MALTSCQECEGKVSTRAQACPHCGSPVTPTTECDECGGGIPIGASACPECGAPPSRLAEIRASPIAKPSGWVRWISPSGRVSRAQWLTRYLLPVTAAELLVALTNSWELFALTSLIAAVPMIAGSIKRLHDTGKSGWVLAGVWAVSMLLGLAAASTSVPEESAPIRMLVLVLQIGFLVYLSAKGGTPGPNQFGPSPVGTRSSASTRPATLDSLETPDGRSGSGYQIRRVGSDGRRSVVKEVANLSAAQAWLDWYRSEDPKAAFGIRKV